MNNNTQSNQHKFIRRSIASAFIVLAILIGVKGNLDVRSGKPAIDVMPGMIVHAIELILKTYRTQKSFEEKDRIKKDRIAQNPDD